MKNNNAHRPDRPYNIRERLALFAEEVVRAAQNAQARNAIAAALSPNLVRAAVSAAANVEEAEDPSAPGTFCRRNESGCEK
jgi:hypothetical protein